MKIRIIPSRQSGSILVISLITCAILGVVLASYLIMVQSRSIGVMRSQSWNASLALAEAGVEEALSHLNRNAPFADPSEATNHYYLSANSWTRVGNTYCAPRRYLGYRSYYDVTISLNGERPYINSTGYLWMADSYIPSPSTAFASIGEEQEWKPNRAVRSVLLDTRLYPLFAVAMAAENMIDLKGNNIKTDSYDSSDPNFSNNGLYPFGQPEKAKKNGDVCSNATIKDSINVGTANINGKAKTGPDGTVYVGKNGYVTGGIDDDFNVDFPSVSLPSTTWFYVGNQNQTINGVSYKHVIPSSGDYYLPGLTGSLYIGTNAHVRLLLTADTRITGAIDEVRIAHGGSLRLYVYASTFSLAGNGVVNENGNPSSFYYFGTPRNTSIALGGNGSFTGAIYAPQANFLLGGGGNDTYDFIGASVTYSVQMNGHFHFHYDENLGVFGPSRGFVPTRWSET